MIHFIGDHNASLSMLTCPTILFDMHHGKYVSTMSCDAQESLIDKNT